MKRKKLLIMILLCISLTSCGKDGQTTDSGKEEILTESLTEKEGREAEETFAEVEDYSVLMDISMDDVLLECTMSEASENYRFCIVLRDGYIYCANLYANSVRVPRYSIERLSEDLLPYLRDIYCIGKMSSDELREIEDRVNLITDAWATWEDGYYKMNLRGEYIYMNVYGENLESGYKSIWHPVYPLKSFRGEYPVGGYREQMRPDFEEMCYCGGEDSRELISYFLNSDYIESWNRYIEETGPDKNPVINSAYIDSFSLGWLKADYSNDRIIRISTGEELEDAEQALEVKESIAQIKWQEITENYPIEEYDYLIKLTYHYSGSWLEYASPWERYVYIYREQHADSIRSSKDYLYFNYDRFCLIRKEYSCVPRYLCSSENDWRTAWNTFNGLFMDIAVIPKGSIEQYDLQQFSTPQEINLTSMQELEPSYCDWPYASISAPDTKQEIWINDNKDNADERKKDVPGVQNDQVK